MSKGLSSLQTLREVPPSDQTIHDIFLIPLPGLGLLQLVCLPRVQGPAADRHVRITDTLVDRSISIARPCRDKVESIGHLHLVIGQMPHESTPALTVFEEPNVLGLPLPFCHFRSETFENALVGGVLCQVDDFDRILFNVVQQLGGSLAKIFDATLAQHHRRHVSDVFKRKGSVDVGAEGKVELPKDVAMVLEFASPQHTRWPWL